jgi:hypothetical protein
MAKKDKIQHLNIFLIKDSYNKFGDTLKVAVPNNDFVELAGRKGSDLTFDTN